MRRSKFVFGILALAALSASHAHAALLFLDNFDVADNASFDAAPLTGRLSGSQAGTIRLAAAVIQQTIAGNQLSMVVPNPNPNGDTGRVRFQAQSGGAYYDWAAGTDAANILSAGGVRIEFDWTRSSASDNWIAFSTGFQASPEPGRRVTDGGTDYGILFRNNGGTQLFQNGVDQGAQGSFAASNSPQHVTIDLLFSSYADGASVTAISKVGATTVNTDTFVWNNNLGAFRFELGTFETGELIDNFSVSTIPVPEPSSLAMLAFGSVFLGLVTRRRC